MFYIYIYIYIYIFGARDMLICIYYQPITHAVEIVHLYHYTVQPYVGYLSVVSTVCIGHFCYVATIDISCTYSVFSA